MERPHHLDRRDIVHDRHRSDHVADADPQQRARRADEFIADADGGDAGVACREHDDARCGSDGFEVVDRQRPVDEFERREHRAVAAEVSMARDMGDVGRRQQIERGRDRRRGSDEGPRPGERRADRIDLPGPVVEARSGDHHHPRPERRYDRRHPPRRARRDRVRPVGDRREAAPRQVVQDTRRNDHEFVVAEAERTQERTIELGERIGERRQRGGLRRRGRRRTGQTTEPESDLVEQTAHVRRRGQPRVQAVAPRRHDDGVEHPVGLDELHQSATAAEPALHVVPHTIRGHGPVRSGADETGEVAHHQLLPPNIRLESVVERAGATRLVEVGPTAAELDERGRERRVGGRANRRGRQGVRPDALGPSEHLARATILERQLQAETSQPLGVRRRTDPEFGRTERLLMVGQDAQPGRGGALRAAPLAFGGTQVGGRQPCGGAAIGTTRSRARAAICSWSRANRASPSRRAVCAADTRTADDFRPPSETFEVARDPFRPSGHLVVPRRAGGLGRNQCDEFGDRDPPGAAGGSEFLAGGHGLAVGSVRVVLGEAGPSEEQARFGEVHHVADTLRACGRRVRRSRAPRHAARRRSSARTDRTRARPRSGRDSRPGRTTRRRGRTTPTPWRCRPATRR